MKQIDADQVLVGLFNHFIIEHAKGVLGALKSPSGYQLRLIDLNERQLLSMQERVADASFVQTAIELGNIANGMYSLLISCEGVVSSQTVVVVH